MQDTPVAMMGLRIQLFGGFVFWVDGVAIPMEAWHSKRARSLVKLLALAPGHRLHRDQVIDKLWPESDLTAAANNFHQTLYMTRRILGLVGPTCLVLADEFLSLSDQEENPLQVDVDQFEEAAAQARGSLEPGLYQSALAFYQGDLLPDDLYEEWTLQRREELKQTYLGLLLDLARLYETRQEYTAGIETLKRLLASDRLNEPAQAALMRLYALSGQRPKALHQYHALKDSLRQELDTGPGEETEQLYQDILAGRLSTGSQREISVTAPRKNNLPAQLTSFIGRETQIDEVRRLLMDHRLVTLTGAGGTGKTRLALKATEALLDHFKDGVFLVELASLTDPELVPQTCAHTLELIPQAETPSLAALVHYLQNKQLLLILDNCEHILMACSRLAVELLKSCSKLTILATSREILNLPGESPFRVPSLTVPDPQREISLDQVVHSEGVRLFVERARQVSPEFMLTRENVPAIAQICQRLDGIPLAIELAAGRARVLSAEQIAARVDHTFRLLTGGSQAVLPRQQTLKATIDWSYDLLSPKERLLLQRLSVFAGGWTLDAAESICSDDPGLDAAFKEDASRASPKIESFDILDLLTSLVDKSLVITEVEESGTRYRMLETIRQYARDRLLEAGGSEKARDRHLDYFAVLTGQAESHLRGKGQIEWLDRLERDLDNLRAAMEWSLTSLSELGLKITADLNWFWWLRGYYAEGRDWPKKLLTREEYERASLTQADSGSEANRILQRARCLRAYVSGNNWNILFTKEESIACLEESVALLRKLGPSARRELAISLYWLIYSTGGLEQPSLEKQEMLDIFQQESMRFDYSEFLLRMSYKPFQNAEWDQAKANLEESLAISREIEDLDGIATRVRNLGLVLLNEGNYQTAEMLVRESIDISHRVKNRWWEAMSYLGLIEIELSQGSYEQAAKYGQVVQSVYLDVKEQGRSVIVLDVIQISAWACGDFEEAVRIGNLILNIPKDRGVTTFSVAKASTYYYLGRVALSRKELAQAEMLIKKAIVEPIRDLNTAHFLMGAAVVFILLGKKLQAVRLFGAGDDLYQRIRLGLPLREREENEQALASAQTALGEENFNAVWKEGQAMTLEQAAALALE